MKAHKIKFKGKDYLVTDQQYQETCAAMAEAARPAVRALEMKAQESRFLWDELNAARKDTFFLTREITDAVGRGAPFPQESVIRAAEEAAAKVKAAVKSKDPMTLVDALGAAEPKVEAASTALKDYTETFFAGTDRLIAGLKAVREICSVTAMVCATVASGGATIEVESALMVSDSAFDSLMKQIDRSASDQNFTIANGVANVLLDGAVGGIVNRLTGNKGFLEDITNELAEKLEKAALKRFGKELAGKVASAIVKGEISNLVSTAVTDVVKSCKPGSKMTIKQAAKDVAEAMLKGALLGSIQGGFSKQIDEISAKADAYFKGGAIEGLGKVEPKKAFAAGGEEIVEKAVERLAPKLILDLADDPKKLMQIAKPLAALIAKDAQVNKEMAALVAKRKLH